MRQQSAIWIVILISVASLTATAQSYHFQYNELSRAINRDIIDLKLESAQAQIMAAIQAEPYNLSHLHLQSYLDFFALFINEDETYFKAVQDRKKIQLDALKRLDKTDPYKRFAQAEIKLHSAIIRSKFGELIGATRELLSAYHLLSDNHKEHPDFIYNKKSLSVIHSLAETVSLPGIVKKIFGINGSIAQGLEEIETVKSYSYEVPDFIFKEEVDAIYVYLLYYQANEREAAIDYMLDCRLDPSESLLATFLTATILQRSGQNALSLQVLAARPQGDAYSAFDFLKYQEALGMLQAGHAEAVPLLQAFIADFGGRHYLKAAHQKLGWASLIFEEDLSGYKYHMRQVEEVGHDLIDADKQALYEAESKQIPDPILLKARLLYDGGYYHKAMQLLTTKAYAYANGPASVEFYYRLGRITQALKNYPEALSYYKLTTDNDLTGKSYHSCNALLQSALIYESQKSYKKAEELYHKCLAQKPAQYQNSLHQKAKTGLGRLKSLGQ